MSNKISVTLATLESKLHEVNAIKSGIKIYEAGHVEFQEREPGQFFVAAEDKSGRRGGVVTFTRDGCDLKDHFCNCGVARDGALCKHIVAGVLAIQGGLPDSKITLGKTATVETVVTDYNTAKAVGSGSLNVFATPMMIALMERAACEVLSDGLEGGQTSVGTNITINHTAATPVGMKVTATAAIAFVHGRNITFEVTASDECGEIGKGTHIRVIVDEIKFMGRTNQKK
jgi:predicted thioesterase